MPNWPPEFWLRVADMGVGALVALVVIFVGFQLMKAQMRQAAAREIAEREESAKREAAWRKEVAEQNKRVSEILDNHLTDVAKNQAATAEVLRTIQDRDAEIQTKALEYMAASSVAIVVLQKSIDAHDREERGFWERLLTTRTRKPTRRRIKQT